VFIGLLAASLYGLNESRRRAQTQTDPRIATVWILGVTQGAQPALTRGSILQKWLNAHDIHALGDYRILTTRYTGDHNSLEIWFDYQSYLSNHAELECHRVRETAFVDDLGQPYHGYLDFQDKYVGVYLPGYDHAARRLTCELHWMPRQPASTPLVSAPMTFTLDLPPAPRVLPPAASLPRGPVMVTTQGITVTVGGARLSAANIGMLGGSQRELTFHLNVQGGELVDSNVDRPTSYLLRGGTPTLRLYPGSFWRFRRAAGLLLTQPGASPGAASTTRPFRITDPYGVSLVPDNEAISPLPLLNETGPTPIRYGMVWVAPVDGAGHGTDAVRLRFDVLPAVHTPATKPIPFDVTIPVQTGDEV
jgi:hypothetical protein